MNDSIEIPTGGTIAKAAVILLVEHSWVGDVRVRLARGGTTRTLIDRPGVPASPYGCAYQDIDVTLGDAGMGPVEQACLPTRPSISGTLMPSQSLSVFEGQDMSGTWTLQVADLAKDYGGVLVEWCLIMWRE